MAVNYDIVYFQNVHYNDGSVQPLLDSNNSVTFQSDLLDKQCNYNVAVNKFKISDMSSIPLGVNIPFNEWECGLKLGSEYVSLPVLQIGSEQSQMNNLYTLSNDTILFQTYNNTTGVTTTVQTITLSNHVDDGQYVIVDSNGNFYVSSGQTLYVYDSTGILITSAYSLFISIVYLSITKNDDIIVTDQGVNSVFIYNYSNGVLTNTHTITKNFEGIPFNDLTSCSMDSEYGIITYNNNFYSLIDSGFNVLKDNQNQVGIVNITGSQVNSSKGLAYVLDNTTQPLGSTNTMVAINTSTYAVELYSLQQPTSVLVFTFNPLNSSNNAVYPIRAFYDTNKSLYWVTDFTTIYCYYSNGTLVSSQSRTNIVYAYLSPDSKLLVCNCYAGNYLLEVWELVNNQVISITSAIRNNKALAEMTNLMCCSSNGEQIVCAYGTTTNSVVNYVTIFDNNTYQPLLDWVVPANGVFATLLIKDIAISLPDEYGVTHIYISVPNSIPAIFANTDMFADSLNLYNINDLTGPVQVLSNNPKFASVAFNPNYTLVSQFTYHTPPYADTSNTLKTYDTLPILNPSSTFTQFQNDISSIYPQHICNYTSNAQYALNLGLFLNTAGNSVSFYVEYENQPQTLSSFGWLELAGTLNTTDTYTTPPRMCVNALDGNVYVVFADPCKVYKSSPAPQVLSSEPFISFENVTWVEIAFTGLTSIECLCWDPITPNVCYAIGGLGYNYIYKGYYNALINTLIFGLYKFDKNYYYYLTTTPPITYSIPYYSPNETQIRGYQFTGISEAITIQGSYTFNNVVNGLSLDEINNNIYVGDFMNNQIVEFHEWSFFNTPVATYQNLTNLGCIYKSLDTYTSQIVSISLTTLAPQTFKTFTTTYMNGIAQNYANNTVLVSAQALNQILRLDNELLTETGPFISYTSPNTIYCNTGIVTKGDDALNVYDYNDYITQVNNCFQSCLAYLVKQTPSITITQYPTFTLNKGTGLLTLTYDETFTNQNNGVYLNNNLYQYFKFQNTTPQTPQLQNLLKLVLNSTGVTEQSSLSLYQLNQLDKLVLQTSLNIYSDVTSSGIRSLNIFTEFDIDTSNTSTMYNEGCLLYAAVLLRNYNMISTNALRTIQYSFYYQFKNGERYKFYITSGNNVSLKLQFSRVY